MEGSTKALNYKYSICVKNQWRVLSLLVGSQRSHGGRQKLWGAGRALSEGLWPLPPDSSHSITAARNQDRSKTTIPQLPGFFKYKLHQITGDVRKIFIQRHA